MSRYRSTIKRNVDPRLAALLIIGTLAAVQYWWWQGLVAVHRIPAGPMQPRGPSGGGTQLVIRGRPEVLVDTLAGAVAPGSTDGPGWKARFDGPTGIAAYGGTLYVADSRNNRIRLVRADGATSTLAGSEAGFRDGGCSTALFRMPSGVAVSADGTVFVADTLNNRIRAIKDGHVSTVAGGDAGYADGDGANARFRLPTAILAGPGSPPQWLLVADWGNRCIRLLRPAGAALRVTTLAKMPAHPLSVAVVPAGADPSPNNLAITTDDGVLDVGGARRKHIVLASEDPSATAADLPALEAPLALCCVGKDLYLTDGRQGAVFLLEGSRAFVLAGACRRSGAMFAFRDGDGEHAGFGVPAGIASDGAGRLYVTDVSNNAVRRAILAGAP
ncbi:MAG: hypothetical protein ACP5VE_11995 [Chthonomonadales bacterium]